MHKVRLKFTDGSNNEAGFKVGSSTYTALPDGFNISSFEYDGETWERTQTSTGLSYGDAHGARFWNGNYIQSNIAEKEIRFTIFSIENDGTVKGTWIHEEAYIHSANNQLQYTNRNIDVQNLFTDLWTGFTDYNVTNIQLDDHFPVHLGTLYNDGSEWVTDNLRHLSTNSINRVLTSEEFTVLADSYRGLHIHNVITTNPAGDADPAEYDPRVIYDRGDVIIYIGDDNVIGTAPESNLSNYDFVGGDSRQLLWDYYDSTTTTPQWQKPVPINGLWGAEQSMLDYLQKRKYRQTSLYKVGIPSATLSSFASTGTVGQDFTDSFLSRVNDLWNEHVQPRVRAIILNLGTNDDPNDIIAGYKELVFRLRSLIKAHQAPVIATVLGGGSYGSAVEAELRFLPEEINDIHLIEGTDLDYEADGVTLTSQGQWDLGLRYAVILKTLLDGELDVLYYEPSVWIDTSKNYAPSGQFNLLEDLSDNPFSITAGYGSGTMTTLNGTQAMRLTETDYFTFGNANPFGTVGQRHGEFELFFVIEVHALSKGNLVFATTYDGPNGRFLIHAPWEDGRTFFDAGANPEYRIASTSADALEIGEKYVLSYSSSVTEGRRTLWINGKEISTEGSATDVLLADFRINGQQNRTGQEVTLGEAIFFANNIGVDNRRKIEGYLAHKWDIPLYNTHPYVDQPPTA